MFEKTNFKLFLLTLGIYSHFGWFTTDDRGKLEATCVQRSASDEEDELPPKMQYHGLHASLIVKGITKFQGQFWNPQNNDFDN